MAGGADAEVEAACDEVAGRVEAAIDVVVLRGREVSDGALEEEGESRAHLMAEVTTGLVDDEGAAGLDEAGGAEVATGFEVDAAAEVAGAFEVVAGVFDAEVDGAGAGEAPSWQ